MENSNTFEPEILIPDENGAGSLKKFPMMIPNSKPIKMLFKKGKIKQTIHAKVAMNSVNKIPG